MEVCNKPDFAYREEAFTLLMANAWELLLKAEWVLDHGEGVGSLYELVHDGRGNKIPEMVRPQMINGPFVAPSISGLPRSGALTAAHESREPFMSHCPRPW
jgi:uncharacterized protein DUF3644